MQSTLSKERNAKKGEFCLPIVKGLSKLGRL